jgi:hypothetical protein
MAKSKITILVLAGAFVAVPVIIAIAFSAKKSETAADLKFAEPSETTQHTALVQVNSTPIINYDDYVRNIPSEERTFLENALYGTLLFNLKDVNPINISDAKIRHDSYNQNFFEEESGYYATEFMVDIESIRQSYRVRDVYLVAGSYMGEFPRLVLCPSAEELIYDSFNCRDSISVEQDGR